jgi:hypothetical protein
MAKEGRQMNKYPTRTKWRAESKDGYSTGLYVCPYDMMAGGREEIQVVLSTDESKFAFDIFNFTVGLGAIGTGVYDFIMVPFGQPMPGLPAELKLPASKYKPACGMPAWNPTFEGVQFEANSGMFGGLIEQIFEDAIGCDEAREGKVPVVWFTGERERPFPAHGATYSAPVAGRIGWLPRDAIPAFSMHAITVEARPAIVNKVTFAQLGVAQQPPIGDSEPPFELSRRVADKLVTPTKTILTRPKMSRGQPPLKHDLRNDLDDDIPENL